MHIEGWSSRSVGSLLAIAITLSLLVASFGVVGAGSSSVAQETACGQQVETAAEVQASNDAVELNRWIETQSLEAAQLSRLPTVQRGNVDEIRDWFLLERSRSSSWGGPGPMVHYIDLEREELLASTDPAAFEGTPVTDLNRSLRRVLEDIQPGQGVQRTNAYVSKGISSRETVRVSFVKAFTDDRGNDRAIVYSVAPHSAAPDLLGNPGDSGVTMVVDAQNRILMEHTGTTALQLQNYTASAWEQPIIEARVAGGGETFIGRAPEPASGVLSGEMNDRATEYGLRGKNYLVASAKVPVIAQTTIAQDVDWIVLVHSPCSSSPGDGQDDSDGNLFDGDDEQPSGDDSGQETGSGFGPGYGLGIALLSISLLGVVAARQS